MLDKHIARILAVTGVITMLPVLQYLAPSLFLAQVNRMTVSDDAGLFYARHWGLLAFCMGALLVYAAKHVEVRVPIMFAAAVEKIGLVVMVALAWNNPALQGLHAAAMFDAVCVVVYSAYLLRRDARV